MSALQIQVDIKRFEEAIRPAYAQRGTLNKASLPAWTACACSMLNVLNTMHDTVFRDPSAGGPKWMQWRKSNASKLLLGLLKAAIESIASAPDWMPVAGSRSIGELKDSMVMAAHGALCLLSFLPLPAWPALREWLREQRGDAALWRVLAWALLEHERCGDETRIVTTTIDAFRSVVSVLDVASAFSPLDRHVQPDPCVSTCLGQLFGHLLPRLIASEEAYAVNGPVMKLLGPMQTGVAVLCQAHDSLLDRVFPLALALWPQVASALRRRPEAKVRLQVRLACRCG